jgi:hypothetical protein
LVTTLRTDVWAGIGQGWKLYGRADLPFVYSNDVTSSFNPNGHAGALLWEGADERAGTKAFGRDTFNSWDDVDNAFKAWAEQFARRLDELGACPV